MTKLYNLTAWAHDFTSPAPVRIGALDAATRQFQFDPDWLTGEQMPRFTPLEKLPAAPSVLALLVDSIPDSWGKKLLDLLELKQARLLERRPVELTNADYLMGIDDDLRMGAIRYSTPSEDAVFIGEFHNELLSQDGLSEMAETARRIELGQDLSVATLSPFVHAASALGGSRPKINYLDRDNALCLAKFPSVNDQRDKGAWEYVSMQLARLAGIEVAEFDLLDIGRNGRTFVSRRFDRTADGARRHYLSTKALLGSPRTQDASYLDILMLIEKICGNSSDGIEQLWRRVTFKILTSNGDDHLRNHGFLLRENGWQLAPAFDLNPSLSARSLSLSWDENCSEFDVKAMLSAAPVWGLAIERAREIYEEVLDAVSYWREVAVGIDIDAEQIERMRPAFRV